jgi:hypothetical protein
MPLYKIEVSISGEDPNDLCYHFSGGLPDTIEAASLDSAQEQVERMFRSLVADWDPCTPGLDMLAVGVSVAPPGWGATGPVGPCFGGHNWELVRIEDAGSSYRCEKCSRCGSKCIAYYP